MNNNDLDQNDLQIEELPVFPAAAPDVFGDRDAAIRLLDATLEALASVVDVAESDLDLPTPCAGFNVRQLRNHAVGWLQFFAAAISDPDGTDARPDPDSFDLGGLVASALVRDAAADIAAAIRADVGDTLVVMSQARMQGSAVLAMALGEYLVHGWDLATATGQEWNCPEGAAVPAREFLTTTVAPEYRGPDSGFFDEEVEPADGASAMDRLLCFTGRSPQWTPATGH